MPTLIRYLVTAILTTTLIACSNQSNNSSIAIDNNSGRGNFSVPQTILAAVIDQTKVSATIIIDNGSGADPIREAMTIADGMATFTKTDLTPGNYSFTIEFEYIDVDSNIPSITLASAEQSGIPIGAGVNTQVEYSASEYDYPDNDSDGIFNLTEISENTDPNDASSTPNLSCQNDQGNIICVNTYLISGSISGLVGSVSISSNFASAIPISQNGAFEFAARIADNSDYIISISQQPQSPSQNCSIINNATGTVNGADINAVEITCQTNSFSIGGTVSGLQAGETISLLDNKSETLNISQNGRFDFVTPYVDLLDYSVSLTKQPDNPLNTCALGNSSGAISGANVENIQVQCGSVYRVSGTVTGLLGAGLNLNSGIDTISLNPNGSFEFILANNANYNVNVVTQPSSPNQTCAVVNGTGTINNADVSNVSVNCTTQQYSIGGDISGLAGFEFSLTLSSDNTLVSQFNIEPGGDLITFIFDTPLDDGSDYTIGIANQPNTPSQACSIDTAQGNITGSDVRVNLNCTTNSFRIGGTVTGLKPNTSVIIQNNNGNSKSIGVNGAYTFNSSFLDNEIYNITVQTQPTLPSQTCTIVNNNFRLSGADAMNVDINCILDAPIANLFPDANLQSCVNTLASSNNWTRTSQIVGLLKCTSKNINNITGMEYLINVTNIDLSFNTVTNLTPLAELTQLEEFKMWSNGLTDITALQNLTNLRIIDLYLNNIQDFSPLDGHESLMELNIGNNSVSNARIRAIQNLPSLKSLQLAFNRINNMGRLQVFTQLETLDIYGNGVSNISALANMTMLTTLNLGQNDISDLSALNQMSLLQTLILGGNKNITDYTPVTNLNELTKLDLQQSNLTTLPALGTMLQLTSLDLQINNIVDISELSTLSNLTSLILSRNNIVDVTALSDMTQLTSLSASLNNIIDVSPLSTLASMTDMNITNNSIGGLGVGKVDSLASLSNLTRVLLTNNLGMSCSELATLQASVNGVSPSTAVAGVDCTAP